MSLIYSTSVRAWRRAVGDKSYSERCGRERQHALLHTSVVHGFLPGELSNAQGHDHC